MRPRNCRLFPMSRNRPQLCRAPVRNKLYWSICCRKTTGATLDALIEATGWLPHTTRAALTGLRKRGFVIERELDDVRGTFYRIARNPATAQG